MCDISMEWMIETPVQKLGMFEGNCLWIKREDLIPFSFGGNKARKAALFFAEIEKNGHDCVVTYGSGSSNHCRVIANLCRQRNIPCHIISPLEASEETYNSKLIKIFNANITIVPVHEVHDTIEEKLRELRKNGKTPYFIEGGGHGNIGTEAYVQCYEEIKKQEHQLGVYFDDVFFASGTGTTQAGLICGQVIHRDKRNIVGISIARKNPYGRNVVLDSVCSYMGDRAVDDIIQASTVFSDKYISGGYGRDNSDLHEVIKSVLENYGIPLDLTYTAKAFKGMTEYIRENEIKEHNILFIHTGGTPLFFDGIARIGDP